MIIIKKRYSPYWNVPVITPGGMATDFGKGRMSNTSEFRLLTRVGINFDDLAHVTHKVLKTFGWDQVKVKMKLSLMTVMMMAYLIQNMTKIKYTLAKLCHLVMLI